MALFIGIDIGTSGCRAIAIDKSSAVKGEAYCDLPSGQAHDNRSEQRPESWWRAVTTVVENLRGQINAADVNSICVDGTSSSLLLIDESGQPLTSALMYNDARATAQAQRIKQCAPKDSPAQGASSTLSKLLWFQDNGHFSEASYPCHQTDWIIGKLCGQFHISDVNNCLKLGYDPVAQCWPEWLEKCGISPQCLPQVVKPGNHIANLRADLCHEWNFPETTRIVAGTTDSTAAVVASGAGNDGEAVTSLGSTLVLKILSQQPVAAPQFGVYSQPLLDKWLVGGASNCGAAVLLNFFSKEEMQRMTLELNGATDSSLDYYPLLRPGERFPINDPSLRPKLTPRPDNDVEFFHGLLYGIARVEQQGYELLQQLGAPYPSKVFTIGGGAINEPWRQMRQRLLNTPVVTAKHLQAAYGSALIALRSASHKMA
ncbi:FGGY-family carbohydrate kinase [Kaarinaea lacus]